MPGGRLILPACTPTSPEQLGTMLKTETDFWSGLVKSVGFTPEG